MGELGGAAWGDLEACGWQCVIDGAGSMLDGRGRVRRKCFEMAEPRAVLNVMAVKRG